jgi:hypothetical protein
MITVGSKKDRGRGIRFLFNSFEQFLQELGAKPKPEYTLERKNNDGNYEPGNVRWATRKEQQQNVRRRNPATRKAPSTKNSAPSLSDVTSGTRRASPARSRSGWPTALQLWHEKSGKPSEGWLFPGRRGDKPADPRDPARKIREIVREAGLEWKGCQAGKAWEPS